jgi:hypothetical protein
VLSSLPLLQAFSFGFVMHRGYIKLFRSAQDNPLYLEEPFTKWQAWQDLLMLANHKSGTKTVRGIRFAVCRGEIAWSTRALGERWQWSRGKVLRFLEYLESVQQIVQQKSRLSSRIAIVNYDKYQGDGTTNGTTDSTTDGTTDSTKEKKVKKVKNVKKESIPKKSYGTSFKNVLLTDPELEKLKEKLNGSCDDYIDRLDGYIESKGAKYKSHYATILNWKAKDDKNTGGALPFASKTDQLLRRAR